MKIASRKFIIASGVIAFVVLCCAVLLSYFPIWRVCEIGRRAIGEYYSEEEIRRALYIGSASDRYEVMGVLELADRAFSDTTHTTRENEQE